MPSRKIEDLDKRFQEMVRLLLAQGQEVIKKTGWVIFITDGFRTAEEQTALYAKGRTKPGKIVTNAQAGQSAHNYGLAVDIAFQKNGVLSYDPNLYNLVYTVARKLGFTLGADWTGFSDKPHFEYPNWQHAIKELMVDPHTIPINKETFEQLVTKSSAYDALVKNGISTASDVNVLKRSVDQAQQERQTALDEAKKVRSDFESFRHDIAEKLFSEQDLPRILSSIDDIIKKNDSLQKQADSETKENEKYEGQIVEFTAEITRLKLLLSGENPLSAASVNELLIELLKRLSGILSQKG